jgi:uncharacterized RDD family membrane protein YckC
VKCPKCGYLGFETGDRCKNCGYDFSLVGPPAGRGARSTPAPAAGGPPARDPHLARGARYRHSATPRFDEGTDRALAGPPEGAPIDLPLFPGDGQALPPPRPPLAVRRATPAPARPRQRTPAPHAEPLPLVPDEPAQAVPAAGEIVPGPADAVAATAGRRAAAAAIDVGLVALVDLVVLHFTLALCGLTFNDLHVLPVLPMAAFLLALDGGYLVLFTGTLGQTLGKMAASIEVVADRHGPMNLGRAAVRGAALIVSLLPAGLGWLAGLVGDGRGLHDRLAGTRVVRVAGT